MLVLITLLLTLAVVLYFYLTWNYDYWTKRGVPHKKPFPGIGNASIKMFLGENIFKVLSEDYNYFEGKSYYGSYTLRKPVLVIRDPDFIERIAVKEFSSFHDNEFSVDEEFDPIMAKNPFMLKGEKWKIARNRLVTQFSTGKIKNMFPLMIESADKMVKYLIKNPEAKGKDGVLLSELANKFTTDSVALCAFGIDAKSFEDPNSELILLAKEMLQPGIIKNMLFSLTFVFPPLAKVFNVKFLPDKLSNFLMTVIRDVSQHREKNNITANDFLDQMLKLQEKHDDFGEIDMLSNITVFFTDGFLVSNSVICFSLYNIASRKNIYKKLQDEVDTVLKKYDGKFTYEALKEMKYLDCVFRETMRMYPPVGILTKVCTHDTLLPNPAGRGKGPDVKVEKGTPVMFPMWMIHYDSKYFPDATKFDPERFSDERIGSMQKNAYFPFGSGPRMCLGQRFALTQIKTVLALIVHNLDFEVNKKTKEPIELDSTSFFPLPKGGFWLNFYKRKQA